MFDAPVTNPIAEQQQAIQEALSEIEGIREAKLSGRDRAMGLDYLIAEIKRDVNLLADEVYGNVKHYGGTEKVKIQEPEITNDDHER